MAKLPASIPVLVGQFGPHPNRVPADGWNTQGEPDGYRTAASAGSSGHPAEGQNERVVGSNRGKPSVQSRRKSCPAASSGMQNEHPDRSRSARPRGGPGFDAVDWETALDRTAGEIRRIQSAYGNDAFGVLTGASLTKEGVSDGQVRLGCPAEPPLNIDYNGRLCMVSAAAASKKIRHRSGR